MDRSDSSSAIQEINTTSEPGSPSLASTSYETDLLINFKEKPTDKYLVTYFIFVLLGVGVLLPWNTFLTAFDYFSLLYPGIPFEFIISLAYNWPSIIMLLLSIKYGTKFSFGSRILTSYTIDFVVLVIVPVAGYLLGKSSLIITLICGVLTGIASATLFGSVIGLSALFPPQYTGAVMVGNGVAGMLVAVLRIVTKASLPSTDSGVKLSSAIYFGISASVIITCVIGYLLLFKLSFSKFYIGNSDSSRRNQDTIDLPKTKILDVFTKVKKHAFTVWSVFFVTLALFPGVTSLVPGNVALGDWFTIILISLFMLGDFIGRSAPRFLIIFTPKNLWIPTALRFIFFLLFILCIKPRVLSHDSFAYAIMMVFAISNGYCSTLAMMFGPSEVENHEKEQAGIIMSFFLNLGIVVAVHFALLLLYLIQGSLSLG